MNSYFDDLICLLFFFNLTCFDMSELLRVTFSIFFCPVYWQYHFFFDEIKNLQRNTKQVTKKKRQLMTDMSRGINVSHSDH